MRRLARQSINTLFVPIQYRGSNTTCNQMANTQTITWKKNGLRHLQKQPTQFTHPQYIRSYWLHQYTFCAKAQNMFTNQITTTFHYYVYHWICITCMKKSSEILLACCTRYVIVTLPFWSKLPLHYPNSYCKWNHIALLNKRHVYICRFAIHRT